MYWMGGRFARKGLVDLMKKEFAIILLVFSLTAGCVSIYDSKVQVQHPSEVDPYQRNLVDKCDPHVYPNRLISAEMGMGTTLIQGSTTVQDQNTFDQYWNSISPSQDENSVPSYSLKPVIDWDHQVVYFLPVGLTNTCEKVRPLAIETDCYNITVTLYKYVEGQNCSPRTTSPVFVYICPKSDWPLQTQWWKTPDYTPGMITPTPGT